MVVQYGAPWRRRQVELYFTSGKEAFQWTRGLEALTRETALNVEPQVKHFLMEMFHDVDTDDSNSLSADELPVLLSHLNFVPNDRWKQLESKHLKESIQHNRLLVPFTHFYKMLEKFMFEDDAAAGLYKEYASPKARIGLERSQFIRLWKDEVDALGLPPPPPVMRMFDQMAAHRKSLLSLKFAQGTSKRGSLQQKVTGRRRSSVQRALPAWVRARLHERSRAVRRDSCRLTASRRLKHRRRRLVKLRMRRRSTLLSRLGWTRTC